MTKGSIAVPLSCLVFILLIPNTVLAQASHRKVIAQVGYGLGIPFYTGELEFQVNQDPSASEWKRFTYSGDLLFGFSLSQNVILIAPRADLFIDRFDSIYSSQDKEISLGLLSFGLRYYPLTFGLFFEGGIGYSLGSIGHHWGSDDYISDSDDGIGFAVSVGYDFLSFLCLEVRYIMNLFFENEDISNISITLNLARTIF
jgi:hypothetical protein